MTTVKVLCTLGCGVEIPVPVRLTPDPGAVRSHSREVAVTVGIAPGFDAQLDWHMRRFHGGRDDEPIETAA